MNEILRAKIILKILNKTYPKIEVPLKSRNVFTLISVHWADNKTEIRSVKTFLLFKGTLIVGYVLFKIFRIILALWVSFIIWNS